MPEYEPVLMDSIDIDAPIEKVWSLVSDVCRMPDWSPQVRSTRLRSGFDQVGLGTQFTNLNSQDGLEWTTHGEIVRFTPLQELAFRIVENWAVWSFTLDRNESGGTRLTQRRETPEGLSAVSLNLTETYLGGQDAFTQSMKAGMRQTIEGVRMAAESAAG
ncbi:SRPBCC family protein [Smaragdicoccus niigatensis]|uniref:SRPBCC family protein n=1 Tax=Smaragdicoccus niigatensis TaxID=359359 RepID=UPI000367657A|nr:SRPBCC family protein [Smaragdicoccus niigatensis]